MIGILICIPHASVEELHCISVRGQALYLPHAKGLHWIHATTQSGRRAQLTGINSRSNPYDRNSPQRDNSRTNRSKNRVHCINVQRA